MSENGEKKNEKKEEDKERKSGSDGFIPQHAGRFMRTFPYGETKGRNVRNVSL